MNRIVITTILSILLIVFASCGDHTKFSSAEWKADTHRYAMAKDLVKKLMTNKPDWDTVIKMCGYDGLGDPQSRKALSFRLRSNNAVFGLDAYRLDITFNENGRVKSALIHRTD